MGTHYEIIKRGALDNSDLSDISLLINHQFNELPIARYRQGDEASTLKISLEDDGLHFEATLDEQNPKSAEVLSCVKRGDIQKMSFGFFLDEQNPACAHWIENPGDKPTMVITRIEAVFDISVVTWPAYESTSVQMKREKEMEIEETDVFAEYQEKKRTAELELLKLKARAKFVK
jgi:HK97 family phage prohead protease